MFAPSPDVMIFYYFISSITRDVYDGTNGPVSAVAPPIGKRPSESLLTI
jgi:hypothetical protein